MVQFRRRKRKVLKRTRAVVCICAVVTMVAILIAVSWIIRSNGESASSKNNENNPIINPLHHITAKLQAQNKNISLSQPRYIEFFKIPAGQGLGNIMAGLLATHLLGDEFHRTVCISKHSFEEFFWAFRPVDPDILRWCPPMSSTHSVGRPRKKIKRQRLITYSKPPDECKLQATLSSLDMDVVPIEANTYPRWPYVPQDYFFKFYEPTPALLRFLPYKDGSYPTVVVHLRDADGSNDRRLGTDRATFDALGVELAQKHTNSTIYLVSNNVEWTRFFEKEYGWSHGHWKAVRHSALPLFWGHDEDQEGSQKNKFDSQQMKQMWADWYALLTAQTVYHTGSDFSNSAIHWRGLEHAKGCRVIQGVVHNKGPSTPRLKLAKEWFATEYSPRLVDRRPGVEGDAELRNCG